MSAFYARTTECVGGLFCFGLFFWSYRSTKTSAVAFDLAFRALLHKILPAEYYDKPSHLISEG